jgi:hypothetical protein
MCSSICSVFFCKRYARTCRSREKKSGKDDDSLFKTALTSVVYATVDGSLFTGRRLANIADDDGYENVDGADGSGNWDGIV